MSPPEKHVFIAIEILKTGYEFWILSSCPGGGSLLFSCLLNLLVVTFAMQKILLRSFKDIYFYVYMCMYLPEITCTICM